MRVELQYFDGCPSWQQTDRLLRQALDAAGHEGVEVEHVRVETPEDAERLGFRGSPTVLVDGVDPFAGAADAVGFACRLYRTPNGLAGSPTYDQLASALP